MHFELNINTGTPFNQALVVDRDITLDKLIAIGRIHGSGTFTSHGEVNIFGNAEIDGDVTLFGDARINFLDHVYKAAIAEAQQEPMLADPYASADAYSDPQLMLAHSQLFSDAAGNNSVVLFTFVEGGYLLNENVIFELIANHQEQDFKFRSYLYGASLDNPAQLQKADGLSPYYANKLALINKLKADSGGQIRMTESLDMAPSNFYHTFEDSQGMNLGTYQAYAMSAQFDINNVPMLTQEERDAAIYNLEHKAEIEAQREAEARQSLIDQKAALYLDTAIDPYSQQAMIAEIEAVQAEMDAINPVAAKTEAEQARLEEWVSYKDMPTTTVDIIAEQVVVPNQGTSTRSLNKRGWIKRIAKRVTRVVVRPVCRLLSITEKTVAGVANSQLWGPYSYNNDLWSQQITINNDGNNCTPVSAAMIINYHRIIRSMPSLYSSDRNHGSRVYGSVNALVQELAKGFGTRPTGTPFSNVNTLVPEQISKTLKRVGLNNSPTVSAAFSENTSRITRPNQFNAIAQEITKNQPLIYSVEDLSAGTASFLWVHRDIINHSMPVIGIKRDNFSNICKSMGYRERKWLSVDTTWSYRRNLLFPRTNLRSYLRFDAYSQYWTTGKLTFVRPN